jgi:fibronectin-binding autotransporter adhesin
MKFTSSSRFSLMKRSLAALSVLAVAMVGSAQAATDTWVGNASVNWNTGANWLAGTVPATGDTIVFALPGTSGTSLTDNISALTVGGSNTDGIDFNLNSAAYTIAQSSATIALASSGTGIGINDLSLGTQTISVPLTFSTSQTVNVGSADGTLVLNGITGSTNTLTKTGSGLLSLNATTSFSNLTITGGTVAAGGENNLGGGSGIITLDGGTLRLSFGNNNFAYNITGHTIKLGDSGVGTGGTIDTGGGGGQTISTVISNNGGTNSLTKTGTGVLFLGATNTYTGATIINQGTLEIDNNGSPNGSINSASTLVMGGTSTVLGTVSDGYLPSFYLQGQSGTVETQTFNGLTLKAGTSQIGVRAISTSAATIALGAIDHTTNAGGIVQFTLNGYGGANTGVITTSSSNDATGILGGYAVINNTNLNSTSFQGPTDYATVSGGNIIAYTNYTTQAAGAITNNTVLNERVLATGNVALSVASGTTDLNTLSLGSAATGTTTITIASGGTLRFGANGGLLVPATGGAFNITGGSLTAGGTTANNPGTLDLIAGANNAYTISSNIVNNGTGAVTLVISSTGSGAASLSGTNSYSGGTYLNDGRITANSTTAFGTGTVYISSQAQAYVGFSGTMANNFVISGASSGNNDTPSAIRFNGGQTLSGTVTLASDATLGIRSGTGNFITGQITGNYNLTIGEGAAAGGNITLSNTSNNWGGNLIINQEKVILGASNVLPDGSAAGNVIITNNSSGILELNGFSDTINGLTSNGAVGVGTVQNTSTGTSVLAIGANNQTGTFNGLITDGGAGKTLGITKTGTGQLTLGDSANAYIGGTIVNGGTLQLSASAGATNSDIGKITGALTVNTGGTFDMNSFSQTVGSLSGTAGVITSNSIGGTTALTVNNTAGGTTTFGGVIQNGNGTMALNLASTNTATIDLTGANTYTGGTTLAGGGIQIGSGGSVSNSGAFTMSNASTLILGDASGAVSQTFNNLVTTSTNTVVGGASSNSTLTLNGAGSATYANAFGGGSGNQNKLNLVIAGTASNPTSILSGTSTYTGTTTVNTGSTLNLVGKLGGTAVTLNSGATLTGVGNGTTTGVIGGSVTAVGGSSIGLTAATNSSLTINGGVTLGTTGTYGSSNYTTLNYSLGGSNAVETLNGSANSLTINSGGAYVSISNPTQTGTFTLASYTSLTGAGGFSLSSTTAGVLSQNVGRDTETLTVGSGTLTLNISGAATPTVAYFDGAVSSTWNDVSNPTLVNWSTDLAGLNDAGNIVGSVSDVYLNANNATTNRGTSTLTETLGASTIINSLTVNTNGTTTLGNPGDATTLTINALAGANAAGVGIVVGAGANPFTINVPMILGGSQSWTNNSSNTFTVAGSVTGLAGTPSTLTLVNTTTAGTTLSGVIADGSGGPLALVVNNTGSGLTTISNGSNTYSGGTTLKGGTLTSAVAGGLGAGSVTVTPTNATATAADNATLNTTGSINSNALVTVNTEASDGGFGIGTINFNGSTPTIAGLSGNGKVVLNNAGGTTLTVGTGTGSNANSSTTFAGVISNGAATGSLIKAGTGTLALTGANTYSGTTAIQSGTLALGPGGSFANTTGITLGSGSLGGTLQLGTSAGINNLTLTGSTPVTGSGTGTNSIVGGNSSVSTLTINSSTAYALGTSSQNVVLGGAGTNQNNLALNDTGAGIVTISNANLYTGGTTVGTGATLIDNSNSNGFGANLSTNIVTINGTGLATINVGGNNNYNNTYAGNGTIKFNFTGGGSDTTTATTAFSGFTGTVELANPGGTNNKLQFLGDTGASGATLKIDSGATAYVSAGTNNFGAVSLSGTGNGEGLGAIRIQNGAILGGTVTVLTSTTIGDGGGTLTGNIASGAATGTQTIQVVNGAGSGTLAFSGNISDGGTGGQIALTLNHGGDVTTLSGTNSYSGATLINASNTLKAGSTGAFSSNSALTDSGTLDTTGFNTTVGSITGSGTVILGAANLSFGAINNASPVTFAGTFTSTTGGGITKVGTGTQILSGASTYNGTTNINGGVLNLGVADGGTTGPLGNGGIIDFGGGILQYSSVNNTDYSARIAAGTSTSAVAIGTNGQTITFATGLNSSQSGGLTVSDVTGLGKLILTGSNAYTGTTQINVGATLQLGAGGTTGALANTSPITDSGLLAFNRANTVVQGVDFSTAGITGTGGLTQAGTGTVVLNAQNAYQGTTTLAAGVLQANAADNVGTSGALGNGGNITFTGGTLQYTSASAGTDYSSRIKSSGGAISLDTNSQNVTFNSGLNNSNSGGLTKLGLGTLTLTGNNLYTGTTTISAGILNTQNNLGSNSGAVNVATGATLQIEGVGSLGSGKTLTLNGTGAAGATGALESVDDGGADGNTFAGAVLLGSNATVAADFTDGSGGYGLTLSGNVALAGSTMTLAGSGNGDLSGVISDSGPAGQVSVSSGTWTLSGSTANTYTGGTTVSGGTLYANNTSGSSTGSGNVNVTGGTLAGSGTIAGAVTVASGGNFYSGAAQAQGYSGSATNTTGNVNASPVDGSGGGTGGGTTLTSTLAVNAGSTLTFALGNGASTGSTVDNPNTNSTYLTTNATAGSITFSNSGAAVNINLVDLAAYNATMDTLQLRYQSPYLLIAAGGLGNGTLLSNLAYNLVTTGGYDANGLVLGVVTQTGTLTQGASGYTYDAAANAFNIQVIDPSTGLPITNGQNYGLPNGLQLYLDNGQLEVVPEPSTWAMMLGGLVLLLVQIRRRRNS